MQASNTTRRRWAATIGALELRPRDQAVIAAFCLLLIICASGSLWTSSPPSPVPPRAPEFLVDLNAAPEPELMLLPRIGPSLAKAIAQERAKRPFEAPADLQRTRGIGEKTLARLLPHIKLAPTMRP